MTELNGNELYVWVVTIYLLTATVSGPIYGKLSDLFGRRPMMMIGVSLFLLGSLLCALSQEMWQLIVFRGVQGLGAGAIFPIALAIIGDLFSPRERGKYQGLFGAVFALASIIGPALGGFLTDTISWHWVFLVNLPLGLVALFVLWRLLPQVRHPEAVKSIDYLGAGVFIAAIVPLLIGLTNAQFGEWSDPQVGGLIVLGLVLGAVFVLVESRAPNRSSRSSCSAIGRWPGRSPPPSSSRSASSGQSSSSRDGSSSCSARARRCRATRCCR